MLPRLLILVVFFTNSLLISNHESRASLAKPGCQETCGNVTIPYPFGIGTGCYLNESFELLCEGSSRDHVPLRFAKNNKKFPILEISNDLDLVRVIDEPQLKIGCSPGGSSTDDSKFVFSQDLNLFVAVGCNIKANFFDCRRAEPFKCESLCNNTIPAPTGSATGCTGHNGCCKHSISSNMTSYVFTTSDSNNTCPGQAFVAENNAPISLVKLQLQLPVALNWVVATTTCDEANKTGNNLCGGNSYCVDWTNRPGYNCRCIQGYKGNPYLPDGCQVAAEIVIGLSAFGAVLAYWIYIKLDRIRKNKIKKKIFIKNGGHLLKRQISANKSCVTTIKVYTEAEMEKATKNFSRSRFLGKGGQGTVYKGLFPDGTVVAIKKSNVVDAEQLERFVNEVFILAQINHRNIVKLLGCCLEYEVPLLVYEYLANNTLLHHLHDGSGLLTFSWKDRIRITREVAEALAYLHSFASPAIFHRDVKPGNILLDQNYKAVLSDFGLSRPIPLSRSHLTTQVEGTFGYLDPEYFQSGKLTAKSDVYSFGVVLTELLTRKKSISSSDSGEGLVPRFKYLVKHKRVVEILDKQVMQEAMMDDVVLVSNLAKRCMKANSKKRPSMEEVVRNLDKLRVVQLEHHHECVIEHELKTNLNSCTHVPQYFQSP